MKRSIVLMYHDVYENDIRESGFQSGFQYKVHVSDFKKQVSAIRNHLDSTKSNLREVFFSFDDGGISFYSLIAPILEEYQFKGIFFVTTKFIDSPNFLTKRQIVELISRGHTIASHSHTHSDLSQLDPEKIIEEWQISNDIIKELGGDISCASVPNGLCNNEVIKAAHQCGIKKLYTSKPTTILESYNGMQIIGRFAIYQKTSDKQVISLISKKATQLKQMIRWTLLSFLKKTMGKRYMIIRTKLFKKRHSH